MPSIRHWARQRRRRRRTDAAWSPARWDLWSVSRPVLGYVLAVDLLALAAIAATINLVDLTASHWRWLAILAAGSAIHIEGSLRIERLRERTTVGPPYVNLKGMWTFAGILVLPPPLAVVLIVTTYVHSWLRLSRVPPYRWYFSASTIVLAAATGAVFLTAISPDPYPGYPHGPLGLVAVGTAALAYWFVNYALVVGAIMLSNPTGEAGKALGRLADQFIVAGALGLGIAIAALISGQPWTLAALLVTVLALHRALLVGHFQDAARTDPLTRVANLAFWHQLAATEIARAERGGTPLGVLYIDLDHFKTVNDTYGHAAGDTVLTAIADELRHELRGDDQLGRLGGEEFAALLPDTTAADTTATGERIRRRIAALTVEVATSNGPAVVDGLTCSIGAATYPDAGPDINAALLAADTAMYAAKEAGRNRVITAPTSAST